MNLGFMISILYQPDATTSNLAIRLASRILAAVANELLRTAAWAARLSCKRTEKTRTLMLAWNSSGELSIGVHSDAEIVPGVRDPRSACRCLVPRGTCRRHQAATGWLPA